MGEKPSGRDGPHVFVQSLDTAHLHDDDDHHLRRVLRVRDGDSLTISTGDGAWRLARLTADGLDPTGEKVLVAAPAVPLTLAFALTKSHKPELTVQKLTEIGITTMVPFMAQHSVVKWDAERRQRNIDRLRRVAKEAAMQSRQVWLPQVTDVQDFDQVQQLPGAVLAERAGHSIGPQHHTVLVGPEGGWSDAERELLPTVGLGDSVLRAETASFVAAALMMDRQAAR